MFSKLLEYFQYDFVVYAFIVGTLIALCSAMLGSVIVTKKMSFIGDGLSHIAFAASTVAMISGISNNFIIILPLAFVVSLLVFRNRDDSKFPSDAILAVISVAGLAFGYMYINLFSKSANVSGDVCGFLFGATSILTLAVNQVITCCILSVLMIAVFVAFYNKIYAVTFDETFAKASGTETGLYRFIIILITDTIIVLATHLVGALLVTALIVLPTISAIKLAYSFKGLVITSTVLSVTGALIGLSTAVVLGTPVGCTIVLVDMIIFALACIFRRK